MGSVPERVAFIGDVGGHLEAFETMLGYLGVDTSAQVLPPGLVVIQVGDLVHKGSASEACVELASLLMSANPDRYIQLVGNHEAHYLGGPDVTGRSGVRPIPVATLGRLQDWWSDGTLRIACAVQTGVGEVLVTHGGLTRGFHQEIGAPSSASDAAASLEGLRDDTERVFRPGALMTGKIDSSAGIICPRTGSEVYGPWQEYGATPFTQIHGHEGVWWWPANSWHTDVPESVRQTAVVDSVSRQSWLDIGSERLWRAPLLFLHHWYCPVDSLSECLQAPCVGPDPEE